MEDEINLLLEAETSKRLPTVGLPARPNDSILKTSNDPNPSNCSRKNIHSLLKKNNDDIIPIKMVFQKLQRIAQDTAKTLDKEIKIVFSAAEGNLKKIESEQLSDSLMHLIRNAIDHGIENIETRTAAGKPPFGTVKLSSRVEQEKLVLKIQDNGAGIPTEALKNTAIQRGLLSPFTALSKKEILKLIFEPGLSTKQQVTAVSGRGIGMHIVRENIEKINGVIEMDTKSGEGTTFKIVLENAVKMLP